MVFESMVTDLLNKYLGQYVQNLDPSQLKIGIWDGNAKLQNLELKDTALDDLNLPIKVVRGHLGKLHLSIPWQNLYNEPTEVTIENLYVLAKPNSDIKYDHEQDEQSKLERKQKQLENIEEARKREEEAKKKGKMKEEEEADSFAEKLATQVVKNLQVSIKNIHVRYEDSITTPGFPFSIGITLDGLSAKTTDGNFIPKVIKESVKIIHKLIKLENLALYWNTNDKFEEMSEKEWLNFIDGGIARSNSLPGMKYILRPITASMKLKINTKPGSDLNIPQFFLSLLMEELGLCLSKTQYHSVMEILESFEMMTRNEPFRKYKPLEKLRDSPRKWWNYAITSVLEEDVRRRLKMWSWKHIKEHRDLCRTYKEKYKRKLLGKSSSSASIKEFDEMEKKLNVVSITIYRQMALNEVLRKKKSPEKKKSSGGWFSGLFSSEKSPEKESANKTIEELMPEKQRQDEMRKLYSAIGYSENEVITPFPKEYVSVKFFFHLQKISVSLREDTAGGASAVEVMKFTVEDLFADVHQRPSAKAIRVSAKIDKMHLFGTPNGDVPPIIIRSVQKESGSNEHLALVNATFETNPLAKENVDQLIKALVQPVEIVYDAYTVEQMLSFFRPPQDVILQDLQDKAYSTFEELRTNSTAGLLYAMEHHSVTDIEISLRASYLILPEEGNYSSCKTMLVVDFGSLKLDSDPNQERVINIKEVDESEVQEKCYDRFLISLTALQILLCEKGQDWNSTRFEPHTPLHILSPLSFDGKLAKALVPDDPRLAQIVMSGELSGLEVSLTDEKLGNVFKLATSIPIPIPSANAEATKESEAILENKSSAVGKVASIELAAPIALTFGDDDEDEGFTTPPDSPITHIVSSSGPSFNNSMANQVKMDLDFKIKAIKLDIGIVDPVKGEVPCLKFEIDDIESQIKICRWDLVVQAAVRRLVLCEMSQGPDGGPLEILSTPEDSHMLRVTYRQCFFNGMVVLGPQWILSDEAHRAMLHYRDEFESTEQIINITFAMVHVILHQEALLNAMDLINKIMVFFTSPEVEAQVEKIASLTDTTTSKLELNDSSRRPSMIEQANKSSETRDLKKKMGVSEELLIRVNAQMEGVDLEICSVKTNLAKACFKGLSSQVEVRTDKTQVHARMKDLQVTDCSEETHYKQIIFMDNEEVFDLELIVFNDATKNENVTNMNAVDLSLRLMMGRMRAVYLHRFVMDLLIFVDNFQIMQEAAERARQVAVESTAAAMASMREYGSRNKLNITIHSPLIIVPIDSLSSLCLMVDLGQLKVYNKFCLLATPSSLSVNRQPAITDNMTLKLTELKISKALVKNGKDIEAHRLLVEPVSMNLGITRSLSTWDHEVPEIEVQGSLKSVKLIASEEDIRAIMEVLNCNMKEGFDAWEKDQAKKSATVTTKDVESDTDSIRSEEIDAVVKTDSKATVDTKDEIWLYTKFSFDIENFIAEVYLRPKDMLDGDEFLERDPQKCLGQFVIGHLELCGSILSDNTTSVSVVLDTLVLDDMRPEREGVTRMIEYHKDSTAASEEGAKAGMLDLMYECNAQLDTSMNIRLKNLVVIFNMEYIMVLTNVVWNAMPQIPLEEEKPSLPPTPTHSVGLDDHAATAAVLAGAQIALAQETGPLEHVPEWKLTIVVQNPQIVLLADSQDKNTNALFMNTLLNFTYMERSGQQQMYGSIADTKIISAAFQIDKRKDTASQVLHLQSVSLYSVAPIGGKPHMNVSTTVIYINLSPATIKTVMACLTVVSEQQVEKDDQDKEKDLSRMWDMNEIRNSKKWYLETSDANKLTPGSMVWARTKSGDYQQGFLSHKDTHFNVYFYPEGELKHSVKDNTSVIFDKVPDENRIRVGSNVIFANKEKGKFDIARVKQIWAVKEKNGGSTVKKPASDDGWEDVGRAPDTTKFLVKSYFDDKEHWKSLQALRLLPRPNIDATPGIGSLVFVRRRNGAYSRGRVTSLRDFRCYVFVYDIDETVVYDTDDTTAVIFALHPRHAYVNRGSRVICFRLKGKQYHPGRVQMIQRSEDEPIYVVKFDDGECAGVRSDQMVLLPKPNTDMVPGVGCFVYAKTPSNEDLYGKAVVAEKTLKRITVFYLSGKKQTYNIRQFDAVVWNIEPNPTDLRVGTLVIASDEEHGREQSMSRGRIREIKTNIRKRTTYLIDFFDGRSVWVTLGKMRVIPEGDQTDASSDDMSEPAVRIEQLILETEGIDIKIEGYLGGNLAPLLSLNSKMQVNLRNWSTNLCSNVALSLEMSYFNEKVAEWEPLLEPVTGEHSRNPMHLDIAYLTRGDCIRIEDDGNGDKDEDEEPDSVQLPMTTLRVDSKDPLELTITKTSLGLLQNLGQIFSKAVAAEDVTSEIVRDKKSLFAVYNMLGKEVIVRPEEFLRIEGGQEQVTLDHNQSTDLFLTTSAIESSRQRGMISKFAKLPTPTISIKVDGYHEIKDIAVKRHRSIIYDIIPTNLLAKSGTNYSIVVEIDASEGKRIITIRSPLQVKNHFPMPLDILYENKDKEIKMLSTIEGNNVFSVPLAVAYHTKLYLKPAGFGYDETTEGMFWGDVGGEKQHRKLFICKGGSSQPFYIQVVSEEQIYSSSTSALERFAPKFTLNCHPPVVLHNYLPTDVLYRAMGMVNFEPLKGGENWPLFSAKISEGPVIELKVEEYLGKTWTGSFTISARKNSDDTMKKVKLTPSEGTEAITIGMYTNDIGSQHVTLYSPYWIVNKTGRKLEYQACGESTVYQHGGVLSQAFMMMIQGSNKKMKLCVSGCEWSNEFSVDTIGSDGSVKSVGKHEKTYEIGVGITLSYFSLTKIVTLTPLHMLSNHTQHIVSLAEADAKVAEFHHMQPGESIPFWPSVLPPKNLFININGFESIRFNPVPVTTLLLKMNNEIGGVCVSFQEKDSASILSFSPYFDGAAPVRIENYCPHISMVSYKQSEAEKTYVLCYGQSILYTWDSPMKSHELTCGFIEAKSSSDTISLDKNGFGRMSADGKAVYWVSFLDGLQRVLLFTEDFKLAYKASQEQTLRPTQEISVNLQSIGLSLADVDKRLDIAYVGIRKSDVHWEEKRQNRWKSMSSRLSHAFEDGYQAIRNQKSISPEATGKISISDLEVDFDKMMITKPTKIRIRRTYHSGLSLQYIVSPNLMQVHAKINSMQIDSHIPGSTFPTVLHPVEPPKSIAAENAPKPFFELSLTSKVSENQYVNEISYFKVLVQEMDVRVDKGFLMAIIDFFTSEKTRGQEIDQYKWDMETAHRKLADSPEFQAAQQDSRYFIDYLHLSPLKIHVSFSMTGGHAIQEGKGGHGAPIVNLLFQSVGVAFTEVQDVEFKLACFEVDSSLLSQQQLMDVVLKHYQHQAVKQLYVLVFGLDVLGNPFGLISGITTGAKNFFYEPYQGLIQGPEEFAQGLALGVKSLVGGTVGGAAGAVSRITGTVGKGLAALTLDDEYQQKRRQQMSQKPTNIGQGLAKGGKSLVKGIFSGVTGIVTKPVEGAKADGAAGFFKGIGKGLIGVVARPTGGLVDMASSTFEGLKSTAGGRKQVSQLRLTRVFHADKVFRPFIEYEAIGNKILMEAEKGKFAKTDSYFAHATVDGGAYVFVTDKKILLIEKRDILNDLDCKWCIPFTSLRTEPEFEQSTVVFKLHSSDAKKSIFSKGVPERTVTLSSEGVAKWFVDKVNEASSL